MKQLVSDFGKALRAHKFTPDQVLLLITQSRTAAKLFEQVENWVWFDIEVLVRVCTLLWKSQVRDWNTFYRCDVMICMWCYVHNKSYLLRNFCLDKSRIWKREFSRCMRGHMFATPQCRNCKTIQYCIWPFFFKKRGNKELYVLILNFGVELFKTNNISFVN